MSLRIQNNFIAWHQRQHIHQANNYQCEICSVSTVAKYQTIVLPYRVMKIRIVYPTLLSNLNTLSHRFINILKRKKGFKKLDISEIAILLLSFWNSKDTIDVTEDLLALSTCIFIFYDLTKRINAEFSNPTISREDIISTMPRLFNIKIPFNSSILNAIFNALLTEKFLPDICINLIIRKMYDQSDILANLFDGSTKDSSFELILSEHIKSLICLTSHNCNVLMSINNDCKYSVFCNSCDGDFIIDDHLNEIIVPITFNDIAVLSDQYVEEILKFFQSDESRVRLNMTTCLPAICSRHSHVLCSAENLYWTNVYNDEQLAAKVEFLKVIPGTIDAINVN